MRYTSRFHGEICLRAKEASQGTGKVSVGATQNITTFAEVCRGTLLFSKYATIGLHAIIPRLLVGYLRCKGLCSDGVDWPKSTGAAWRSLA